MRERERDARGGAQTNVRVIEFQADFDKVSRARHSGPREVNSRDTCARRRGTGLALYPIYVSLTSAVFAAGGNNGIVHRRRVGLG